MTQFAYICPQTGQPLQHTDDDQLCTIDDHMCYARIDGIWRMLPPNRLSYFSQFIEDYERIRRSEGRGSQSATWYRDLPFPSQGTPFADDWRIRGKSYQTLLTLLTSTKPLNILDLGAGNGWLSNRLAEQGHCVAAVDLLTNSFDGLGAQQNYTTHFTAIQAEYDHLPFDNNQFDVVIYNGSLHYALDYICTLQEARRVLRAHGHVTIMDSPVYHNQSSGKTMVNQREEHFERTYGTRSNALNSEHFLTYARLESLADQLDIRWHVHTPNYGLRWKLRPLKARLRGHREPAKFHVIVGQFS